MQCFRNYIYIFAFIGVCLTTVTAHACNMSLIVENTTPLEDLQIRLKSSFGGQSNLLSFYSHTQSVYDRQHFQTYDFLLPPPFCKTLKTIIVRYKCDVKDVWKQHMLHSTKSSNRRKIGLNSLCE